MVFTRTKHGADKIMRILVKAQIKAEAIHGNKSQNARQSALKTSKEELRVFVATDIAARGIDIDDLNLVINYDVPNIARNLRAPHWANGKSRPDGRQFRFATSRNAIISVISKTDFNSNSGDKDHPFPAENVEAVKAVKSRTKQNAGRRGDKGKPDVNKSHMQRPVQNSHAEHAPKILIRKAQ